LDGGLDGEWEAWTVTRDGDDCPDEQQMEAYLNYELNE
jgi:hypothetical protein